MTTEPTTRAGVDRTTIGVAAAAAALTLWVYLPALADAAERWATDPQYSHGYLVPAFALVLLVRGRGRLAGGDLRPDWRGLIPLAAGAAGFVAGGYLYADWLAAGSLIPTLLGLALVLGGRPALRWAAPAVGFLAFMLPLPYRVETALGRPLQSVATASSTWALQTLGLPAVAEGNVILLENGRIAVVEACNGLSMLLTFAAMTTAVAVVVRRPLFDRVVLVLSTVPVALAVNVARITANGVAIEVWDVPTAHRWFHDQGGWLMMPLAVALLGFELWVLGRLFVDAPAGADAPALNFTPGRTARQPAGVG